MPELPTSIDKLRKVKGLGRMERALLFGMKKTGTGKGLETIMTALNTEMEAFKEKHNREPTKAEIKKMTLKLAGRMF